MNDHRENRAITRWKRHKRTLAHQARKRRRRPPSRKNVDCLKGTAHRFTELDRKLAQLTIDIVTLNNRANRLKKECEAIYKEFRKIEEQIDKTFKKT